MIQEKRLKCLPQWERLARSPNHEAIFSQQNPTFIYMHAFKNFISHTYFLRKLLQDVVWQREGVIKDKKTWIQETRDSVKERQKEFEDDEEENLRRQLFGRVKYKWGRKHSRRCT